MTATQKSRPSPAAEPRSPDVPRRVLAMDGGGVMTLLTLTIVQRLEEAAPGFLRAVDLFAGTSAGGISGLLMASEGDPAEALDACFAMWDGRSRLWRTTPLRTLRALEGGVSIYDNDGLREALEAMFGQRTLGELHKGVSLMAFDVAGRDSGTWSPVVFSNVGPSRFYGETIRVVDAALATSALPMTMPIAGGYVDGGLYANNPSMGALGEIFMAARAAGDGGPILHAPSMEHRFNTVASGDIPGHAGALPGKLLDDIRVLSLGIGGNPVRIEVLDAAWGWRQWMADIRDPARFVQATHAAVEQSVNLYCQQMLGTRGYHRVQPPLPEAVHPARDFGAAGHHGITDRLREMAVEVGMAADLGPTLKWLESGGWE